ncbi:MAG: serine/threonine protein kinase [Alkalinema sp. FL-bin-369]|nr:serine/threonine protein kinase [Leptolyngbyaceae cyanobacterium LF-bin-369]
MAHLINCVFHNRYRIDSLLGQQTGRRTCLATDLQTGTAVVVKLLLFGPDFTWSDLKLFEREAAVLKSLDHDAIPKYLDSFEVETELGKGFALVQSYIKAKSLQQWMQSGRTFSEAELRAITTSLLKTLDYLHQRHPAVVHRDVKPSNILLSDRSWWHSERVYLVDFGSVQTAAHSGTRTVVGTYGYMPPEQFGGQTLPASDLYALGATLICLASGQSPDQLPQREMRLLFESQVTLCLNWINWLKWLTEPSLDRRALLAKQALEVLEQFSRSPLGTSFQPSQPPVTKEADVLEPPQKPVLIVSGGSDQSLVTQSNIKNGISR